MKINFYNDINNINKNRGYSLVEIIIYLAIFTSVSLVVINSLIVSMSSFSVVRSNRDILESGTLAMERISREIRNANSVATANSTLGSSPGTLELNTTDINDDPTTIKFTMANGAINLYAGGTLTGNLLGSNISVTSLIFRHIITTEGEAVKIEMTLSDTRTKQSNVEKFYNTVILRGSYN